MSNTLRVLADNGNEYTAHINGQTAYVYAFGHRVYGTVKPLDFIGGRWVRPFKAHGKWAFCLSATAATVTIAVNAEEVSV